MDMPSTATAVPVGRPARPPRRRGSFARRAALAAGLLGILLVSAGCQAMVVPAPGDPSGLTTGSASQLVGLAPGTIDAGRPRHGDDVEPFAVKLADLVDQNRLGVNFTWLLMTGFLVMFMQAGFALVETGFTPGQERHAHDVHELHGLRARHRRLLPGRLRARTSAASATWACGNLGGLAPLERDVHDPHRRHRLGPVRDDRVRPVRARAYDVGVIAFFLFQLVFMDTTATIPTGLDGRALALEAVRGLRPVHLGPPLPDLRGLDVGRRLALASSGRSASVSVTPTSRDRASSTASAAGAPWRGRSSSVRASAGTTRTASVNADPRAQPDPRHPRHVHPRLRLVRVQPGQHVRRSRQRCAADRDRGGGHVAGVGLRRRHGDGLHVGRPRASRTPA